MSYKVVAKDKPANEKKLKKEKDKKECFCHIL